MNINHRISLVSLILLWLVESASAQIQWTEENMRARTGLLRLEEVIEALEISPAQLEAIGAGGKETMRRKEEIDKENAPNRAQLLRDLLKDSVRMQFMATEDELVDHQLQRLNEIFHQRRFLASAPKALKLVIDDLSPEQEAKLKELERVHLQELLATLERERRRVEADLNGVFSEEKIKLWKESRGETFKFVPRRRTSPFYLMQ